jgi:co-chaperonin GroES (HSP10)
MGGLTTSGVQPHQPFAYDAAELNPEERKRRVAALIEVLESKDISAEQQLAAQEELDFFAREILDWFQPVGYKLLVYINYLQEKLESGMYQPKESRNLYESAAIWGYVIALGPEAYRDEKRFNGIPWCKEGDRIMFRAYSGTRFKRGDYPFLYVLMNDDAVEAVMQGSVPVERPRY